MKLLRILGMTISLVIIDGCIAVHPISVVPGQGLRVAPPPIPPNPILVQSCESTRTAHNTWTLLGAFFGGAAGTSGAVDAVTTNKTVQAAVGIGIAASGILAAISTTAASIEADNYSTNGCAAILSAAAASSLPSP
jgi:hypothetical protein